MTTFLQTLETFFWNVLNRPGLSDIADILIVAIIIYELLMLTRDTRGSAVLKGLAMLLLIVGISNLFGLTALNWLLMSVVNNGALVLVILFQPELRKALEELGQKKIVSSILPFDENKDRNIRFTDRTVNEIVRATSELAKAKTGALIIMEKDIILSEYERTGIIIDSAISSQLLINIFEHNTPLHDGAVIVRGDRIVAATCYLPLSDNMGLSKDLGTRHRAAVGISEVSDSLTVIVSEETGMISVAVGGKLLRNIDGDLLRRKLNDFQGKPSEEKPKKYFWRRKGGDRT